MTKPKATSRTKKQGTKSIPWDLILADYLGDHTTTYSGLAKKYKVSKSSIGKKAKKDKWVELRQNSTNSLIETVQNNKAEQIADANKRHLEGAQIIQEATLEGIRRIKDNEVEETIWLYSKDKDAPEDMEEGERREKGRRYIHGPVYYSKTLSELIRSYRIAADLERNVLGLANTINKFGDEDGLEQPIVYDIMGGAKSAKRDNRTDDDPTPAAS